MIGLRWSSLECEGIRGIGEIRGNGYRGDRGIGQEEFDFVKQLLRLGEGLIFRRKGDPFCV